MENLANLIYDCKEINDNDSDNMIMVLINTNLRKGYPEIKIKNKRENASKNMNNTNDEKLDDSYEEEYYASDDIDSSEIETKLNDLKNNLSSFITKHEYFKLNGVSIDI